MTPIAGKPQNISKYQIHLAKQVQSSPSYWNIQKHHNLLSYMPLCDCEHQVSFCANIINTREQESAGKQRLFYTPKISRMERFWSPSLENRYQLPAKETQPQKVMNPEPLSTSELSFAASSTTMTTLMKFLWFWSPSKTYLQSLKSEQFTGRLKFLPAEMIAKEMKTPTTPYSIIATKFRKNSFFFTWNLSINKSLRMLLRLQCMYKSLRSWLAMMVYDDTNTQRLWHW